MQFRLGRFQCDKKPYWHFGLRNPPREIVFTKPDSFEFRLAAAWRRGSPRPKTISKKNVARPLLVFSHPKVGFQHARGLELMWFAIGRPLDEQASSGEHGRAGPNSSA